LKSNVFLGKFIDHPLERCSSAKGIVPPGNLLTPLGRCAPVKNHCTRIFCNTSWNDIVSNRLRCACRDIISYLMLPVWVVKNTKKLLFY